VENILFNKEAVMEQLRLVSDRVHSLIKGIRINREVSLCMGALAANP
jgi:hypothetical protein